MDEESPWRDIPDVILITVLQYLPLHERLQCALVCRRWADVFSNPQLWRSVEFKLHHAEDLKQFRAVENYGAYFRSVKITLDQFLQVNRDNACLIMDHMANESGTLKKITLKFRGMNPLFYAGSAIISSLCRLFTSPVLRDNGHLTHVDISGMNVRLDDFMICELVNCPNLKALNIKNRTLCSLVSPTSILHVVAHCPKLCDLRLHYSNMSDEILERLCHDRQESLQFLSLFCTRTSKFYKVLSSEAWAKLVSTYPEMRVGLHFDHNIAVHVIWDIMLPEIPVRDLRLETYTDLTEELRYVTTTYPNTLQRLSVQTPHTSTIDDVVLNLAQFCTGIEALYVFCVLRKETIERVLEKLPKLRLTNRLCLNHEKLPQPWMESSELEEAFS